MAFYKRSTVDRVSQIWLEMPRTWQSAADADDTADNLGGKSYPATVRLSLCLLQVPDPDSDSGSLG